MIIHAKAAVADRNGSLTIEDIEVHPPQAGEVRVALKSSGICHTDYDSLNWGYHHVLGHERAGIEQSIEIDMRHFEWDKIYMNTLYGMAMPEFDFPKLFDLYSQGALKLDELIEGNRKLHVQLQEAGIACSYREFPGGHEWPYRIEHIAETFRFFDRA